MKKINSILIATTLALTSTLGVVSTASAAATTSPTVVATSTSSSTLSSTCPINNTQLVTVDLGSATSTSIQAGSPLTVQATVKNISNLSLSRLTVFTRVVRVGPFPTITDNDPVSSQMSTFSLLPQQSQQMTLSWQVPQNAVSGTYRLETQVVSGSSLVVGGSISDTSATTSSALGSLAFQVTGGTANYIVPDNSKMTIAGKNITTQYVLSGQGSVVSVPITTNLTMATTVPVTWTVYRLGKMTTDNIVETTTQNISVVPKGTLAQYMIKANSQPRYTVVATVNWNGASSSAVAPIYHSAANSSDILSFAALKGSPFAQTNSLSAVGCVTLPSIPLGTTIASSTYSVQTLTVAAVDNTTNHTIATQTYTLPPRQAGKDTRVSFDQPLSSNVPYDNMNLVVIITSSATGEFLQGITLPYTCQTFENACSTETTSVPTKASEVTYIIIMILILLALIGLIIELIRHARRNNRNQQTPTY